MLGSRSAPVVIDWGNASRGDPHADVARTYLIHPVAVPRRTPGRADHPWAPPAHRDRWTRTAQV